MDMLPISCSETKTFLLILIRVGVILFIVPFFNSRVIPNLVKAGIVLAVTIILFPVVDHEIMEFPDTSVGLVQLILAEAVIGMILGLLVQIFFEAVKIMGQLVGFQTGFAITNILDPQSGTQVSILANMAYLVAMILFLVMNGHHILIAALKDSFEIIQVGHCNLTGSMFRKIMDLSTHMFGIAIKIGAPAIGALLFTKVAFGLITKLMPQMNIMIVAFPVQIVVGLLFFGISLYGLLGIMEEYVGDLKALLRGAMTLLGA
ncbi:MAG: flagellar biosynthetic protein FliR [Thermodesulfobacteriota bacterium]